MRLLISWARDFVDVQASPRDIAETLALRGFEVASVEDRGAGDGVIDFEVTANRPDCLSVLGLAREIATAYDLPLRPPSARTGATVALATVPTGTPTALRVAVEDADLCPRYAAAVADVAVHATSPAWITDRLHAAGIRPVSPLVDITNYVLVELGHPLHAFDLSSLSGTALRIRRAAAGEVLTTLDHVTRALDSDMLVIADAERPQAVAGVMGGAGSEVSATTRRVVFESAYFKPASVRRTSKRLGLKTEASSRFERGADINAPVVALQRALALLQQIEAGRVVGPIADVYPQPRGPRRVVLRRARLRLLLGLEVPDSTVERILGSLGLAVTGVADGWDVAAPTFRVDVTREVDLIEEVGRHYGFDKLPSAFPAPTTAAPAPDPRVPRDQLVRRVLTSAGLHEAVTFGFIEARAARAFVADAEMDGLVAIANPLSAKFDTLRPSLIPGLVDVVAHNRRHGRRDVAVFEIGARFHAATGETRGVGMALTGALGSEHWSGDARPMDFFDVTGVVEHLCQTLGVPVRLAPATRPFLVAGQTADVFAGDLPIGIAGVVTPALAEERGAPRHDPILVAEVSLDRLAALGTRANEQVRPLPRFPSVVRDLSIIVADTLPAAIIRGTIQTAGLTGLAPLAAVTFFDRYTGKGLSEGTVSVSVRLTFQASDRTLTDAEVQQSVETVLAALTSAHAARQR
ncbi:MAG: phenylalanine--tRNA ligase subunit beta [Acidobacteria bacterium]|nr:phenylalanine--tRNA ligase subunit beta [Acidobacteriota bacterium]